MTTSRDRFPLDKIGNLVYSRHTVYILDLHDLNFGMLVVCIEEERCGCLLHVKTIHSSTGYKKYSQQCYTLFSVSKSSGFFLVVLTSICLFHKWCSGAAVSLSAYTV